MSKIIHEIVGAKIGKIITNDREVIIEALANHRRDFTPLTRIHMKFMAACDLGDNWTRMANGPTLWRQDEDGNLIDNEVTA